MNEIYEKIIYTNDTGNSIQISYSFPFFLQEVNGADGIDSIINKTKSNEQDGYSYNGSTLEDRPIQIIGVIKSKDKIEAARYRAQLYKIFTPKGYGILQYEYGDVKRKIKCKVERAPKFQKKNSSFRTQIFLIDLMCENPYWQEIQESKTDVATERGGFEFPLNIPVTGLELSIRTVSFITNIYNRGDVDTPIKVKLKAVGIVENPTITNLETGEFIKVKRTLAKDDTLEINTEFGNKRVEIIRENGIRENVFNYIDYKSRFFSIPSGDTKIQYGADFGENNLDVYIYYTPQYLGV